MTKQINTLMMITSANRDDWRLGGDLWGKTRRLERRSKEIIKEI